MESPVLDPAVIENLRHLTGPGEPDVLAEVLTIFLSETPKRLSEIDAALRAADRRQLHRAAHSLKGSAGNIGARRLFGAARELDDCAQAGDPARLAGLVDDVRAESARVEAAIQHLLQSKS